MANEFMVSVCDVIIRDTVADQIMVYGKTELDTSIAQEVASSEINGGFGNKLLYDFNHSKRLNFTVSEARWEPQFIAINSGVLIANGAKDVFKRESISLDAGGVGTVSETPAGNVYLKNSVGTVVTVTPSGTTVTYDVAGFKNTTVEAIYKYSETVDYIDFSADTFPNSYELTLIAKVFNKTGQTSEVQIIVPFWKPMGSFTMNFTPDGFTSTPIEGKALVDEVNNTYGRLNIVPITQNIVYVAIAATPSEVALSTGESQQITTYGVRGGGYSTVTFDVSDCTYASSAAGVATVSASGLIEFVSAGSAIITVTHTSSTLTDVIEVTCT